MEKLTDEELKKQCLEMAAYICNPAEIRAVWLAGAVVLFAILAFRFLIL